MKKIIAFIVFCTFICAGAVFAEGAKIIDVHGKVTLKQRTSILWGRAWVDMELEKGAQIKTYKNSWCTLAFDDDMKNTLTIRENSQIRLDSLYPVEVNLPKGRVFALVNEPSKVKEFKIRTPVAVAGVMGTGESVESGNNGTQVWCFDGKLFIQGVDTQDGQGMSEDFKILVDAQGNLGVQLPLSPEDLEDWQEFLDYIRGLLESADTGSKDFGYLGDLIQEYYSTSEDELFEQRRRNEETRTEPVDTGGGDGDGDVDGDGDGETKGW